LGNSGDTLHLPVSSTLAAYNKELASDIDCLLGIASLAMSSGKALQPLISPG
jgi:hypothetical protein